MPRSTLVMGPMFAGKSQKIIRHANRWHDVGKNVLIITYAGDIRNVNTFNGLTSHSSMFKGANPDIKIIRVNDILDITEDLNNYHFIGVDEIHLLKNIDLLLHRIRLSENVKEYMFAGLDADSDQKYYSDVMNIAVWFEKISKLKAICVVCHKSRAVLSKCFFKKDRELIGGADMYYVVCELHERYAPDPDHNGRFIEVSRKGSTVA